MENENMELITISEFANMIKISVRSLHRYRNKGNVPAPIMIAGQGVRWERSKVQEWISAGCPMVSVKGKR